MKGIYTKARFKAEKKSACIMCKPWKRGWESKRKPSEQRDAIGHEQQLKEAL